MTKLKHRKKNKKKERRTELLLMLSINNKQLHNYISHKNHSSAV